jgi:branched-chain amino acid transport system ATP-binding protein
MLSPPPLQAFHVVIAGLDPAIHAAKPVHSIHGFTRGTSPWIAGSSPVGTKDRAPYPSRELLPGRQNNARDIGALYLRAEDAENAVSVGNVVREDTILETEDLTKEFAGFVAVRGVSLRVRRGSIHALIGPNGAGKTTCFNLLTKFMAPTRGRIVFDGRDITALKPADVAQLGLGRSFQISAVFPHLTVLENVRIALQRRRGASFDFWRSKRILRALDDRAQALIADVGLSPYAKALAVELPYGRKRALEIATTLALDPELMLLDEPMAGMGREDIARISALIKSVAATRTVLMVEHNLSVVSDLCDCITVLTRGQVLAEGDYKTVSANPAVREAYLGTGHS